MRSRSARGRGGLAALPVWVALCGLLGPGCQQIDEVALPIQPVDGAPPLDAGRDAEPEPPDAAPDANTGADATLDAMASTDAAPDAGPGPICLAVDWARAGTNASAFDAAALAARAQAALCSCQGAVIGAPLQLRASGAQPADFGLNAELAVNAQTTIGGALRVGGIAGLNVGNGVELVIDGDLAVGGPLQGGAGSVRVGGDAAVAGRIDLAALSVAGTLMQPEGATLEVSQAPTLGGQSAGEVRVPPPCACNPSDLLDIPALVEAGLSDATDADCDAGIVLASDGALYVSGDLQVAGELTLVPDRSVLNVVVSGNVRIDGPLRLGSEAPAATVHLFVGGNGTIELPSGGELHGVLYAPNAELVLGAPMTVHGALFVGRLAAALDEGQLTVVR